MKWLVWVAGLLVLTSGCVSPRAMQKQKQETAKKEVQLEEFERENARLRNRVEVLAAQVRAAQLEQEALRREGQALTMKEQELTQREQQLLQRKQQLADTVIRDQPQLTINPDTGGIVLGADVLFAPGKAVLTNAGLAMLERLLQELSRAEYADYQVQVAGHTDTDPIRKSAWDDNWQLSAERARQVLRFLVDGGVGPDRVFLSGYGPNQPRDGSKEDQRRVEVILVRK